MARGGETRRGNESYVIGRGGPWQGWFARIDKSAGWLKPCWLGVHRERGACGRGLARHAYQGTSSFRVEPRSSCRSRPTTSRTARNFPCPRLLPLHLSFTAPLSTPGALSLSSRSFFRGKDELRRLATNAGTHGRSHTFANVYAFIPRGVGGSWAREDDGGRRAAKESEMEGGRGRGEPRRAGSLGEKLGFLCTGR